MIAKKDQKRKKIRLIASSHCKMDTANLFHRPCCRPGDFCAVGCYISQKGNQIIGLIPWKTEEEAGPQLIICKRKNKAFSVVFAFFKMYNKDSQSFHVFFCPFFRGIFFMISKYFIQHCFICRPSDFTLPEDAGSEPRTVSTLALAVRRSNLSAKSHLHLFSFQSCLWIPVRECATLREKISKDNHFCLLRWKRFQSPSNTGRTFTSLSSLWVSPFVREVEVLPV